MTTPFYAPPAQQTKTLVTVGTAIFFCLLTVLVAGVYISEYGTRLEIDTEAIVLPNRSNPSDSSALVHQENQEAQSLTISPELHTYLETAFCDNTLCQGLNGWSEWIIVDNEHPWQVSELAMTRTILLETITALDESGFDGRLLLAGYRFRKVDQAYVIQEDGRRVVALVSHDVQEITLAATAFLRQQGYPIYHELGHVIDKRLNRQLGARYLQQSHAGQIGNHTAIGDGYWVRQLPHDPINEGVADAVAIWIMLDYAGKRAPIFPGTPVDTDPHHIAQTVEGILLSLSGNQ